VMCAHFANRWRIKAAQWDGPAASGAAPALRAFYAAKVRADLHSQPAAAAPLPEGGDSSRILSFFVEGGVDCSTHFNGLHTRSALDQ